MSDEGDVLKTVSLARLSAGEQPTLLASSGAPPDDWVGREIAGRYRVLERIGMGGMGVVYVAEHLHLKKKVAFKVIHPELAANEELLLRFKREALATGQLDHPHIAAAIDFDQLPNGVAFMVMPWVRGQSLQTVLDSGGKFEIARVCRLGAQIADALAAAHAVGIVHRDLKPDNVLLDTLTDGSESCKVLDFGVASLTGRAERISIDTSRPLTRAGTVLGTPGYMSPEQATAGEIDHRTDLYALGVMLWELCRGTRLFDGEDVTQIFAKQFNVVPPALALGASPAAAELSGLVQRLLAWNKSNRPDTAAEVRDALRRIGELPQGPTSRVLATLRIRRTGPIAAGLLLSLGLLFALFGGGSQPERLTAEVPAPPPRTAVAVAPTPEIVPAPTNARVERGEPETKGALSAALGDVLDGHDKDTRRDAARLIEKRPGQVPRFAELAAALELASRCPGKKQVISEIRTLGDPRLLTALERLADTPRRGCGLLRLNDCFGCLRRSLQETISELRAVGR